MSVMVSNFRKWTEAMQFYRVPVIGAMILLQGCIIVPLVLFTVAGGQATSIELPVMIFSTFLIITLNLADMPTKITIPVFAATTFAALMMVVINLLS